MLPTLRNQRVWPGRDRYVRIIAGLSACSCASPSMAQLVPPPTPIPTVIQTPMPTPALPQLSAGQAIQLAALIAKNEVAQGLRDTPSTIPSDNDGLVMAALDHARAVRTGRLQEVDFQRDWAMRPVTYDPLPDFQNAVTRDRLAAWIAMLPPAYAGYDALTAGLARYRAIAAAGGWKVLAVGPDLVFGMTGPRVVALRERLRIEDPDVASTGDRFDPLLLDAVRRAQRRYGLNPTGNVSAQTFAALAVPVESRIRQIKANMERWRWLPPELEKDRVQVNVAAAVLTLFRGDQPVMSMKAVTGRPGDETPMLTSRIHSIVLNPPWNVPAGIAQRELWPKEKASPGYLARNSFRVIEGSNGSKRLQQASERSALGKYKFDFDNPFAVYLHDTPAQAGFTRFDRLASHGCVRLEKPGELAHRLMANTADWPAGTIDATVAAGKTVRARLADPVAVYLLYWTAFATPGGQVGFRNDPYRWDGVLAAKIEARAAHVALTAR